MANCNFCTLQNNCPGFNECIHMNKNVELTDDNEFARYLAQYLWDNQDDFIHGETVNIEELTSLIHKFTETLS